MMNAKIRNKKNRHLQWGLCLVASGLTLVLSGDDQGTDLVELEEYVVIGEQLGYHRPTATTALKVDASLLEIPGSVFVINDALIADQQAYRLDQILQNDASVQKRNNFLGAYSSYFIRGFSLDNGGNYLRNGRTFFHLASPPVEILNRVEVVKGPSSVLYGTAAPGGMINMVTKKPLPEFGGFVKGTAGTDDLLHFQMDVGGPMVEDGSLSYRLNYVTEESEYFREFADGSAFEVERSIVYAALRWQATEETTIDLAYDFTKDERPQDTGIVALGESVADIPSTRILSQPWSYYDSDVWNLNLEVKHSVSERLSLATGYSYQSYIRDRYDNQPRSLDEETGDMEFRARHRINRWDYQTVYGEAIFNIETDWGFHQVLLGADYTRVDVDNNETSRNEVFMTNIFNPVVVPDPMIPVRDEKNIGSEDRTGLYVQDLISFGDKWSVLFGLRYDEFASDFSVAGTPSSSLETENVTPRAGIVFHPDENLSFYGSYSESFEPNNVVSGGFVNDGEQLDPTTGVQYEVGAKAELFDRKLLLSGAAFLAWRTDIPFEDREANRLLQRGEQRHKGIELTATGLVGEHLSLVGSVAFLNAEFTRDDNPALVGNTPSGVADFSASFWAEYQVLDGFLRNLSLQGGWFYEDDRPGDDNNTFVLSSYHRFDVGLKYAWELAEDRSLVLRLTVSNLFDEEYFKGDRRFEVNPERPREVRISGQISF